MSGAQDRAGVATAPVLVTGATGTIGRRVVDGVLVAGQPVRAAAVSTQRVVQAFGDAVEPVGLDFTDPCTWARAYSGVEVMFLMRPPHLSAIARDMAPSLEAAKTAGVQHMVLLSLQGAETNRVVPHAKIEAWLRASGLAWTFVRPSFFLENLTSTHLTDVRDRGEIMVPAGKGRTAFVAASDVAEVATAALLEPAAHRNHAWTPTGPQALTYGEVAAILSDVLGRPIRYRQPGALRYARHARSVLGMPIGMVLVTTAIYSVARFGRAGGLTHDVLTVTGHEPVGVRAWAEQNRDAWAP
jgi:uncharacterized protein YbjT (DUF2867 family)